MKYETDLMCDSSAFKPQMPNNKLGSAANRSVVVVRTRRIFQTCAVATERTSSPRVHYPGDETWVPQREPGMPFQTRPISPSYRAANIIELKSAAMHIAEREVRFTSS